MGEHAERVACAVRHAGRRGMSARRRQRADSESAIYVDRDDGAHIVVGQIVVRSGRITAFDASGRKLGDFTNDREALGAIHTARRIAS